MAPSHDERSSDADAAPQEAAAPRSRLHRVLTVAVPAIIVLGLLAYGVLRPAPDDGARGSAPSFELESMSGGSISSDDLAGDPVVINFWASWCIPCRDEMPAFDRMWNKYRNRGLQVVGVNVQDSEVAARAFVRELDIGYPLALDPGQTLARDLGVAGLPHTVFIDGNYELLRGGDGVVLGEISENELEKRILELLE